MKLGSLANFRKLMKTQKSFGQFWGGPTNSGWTARSCVFGEHPRFSSSQLKKVDASEGDINLSTLRQEWLKKNIDPETDAILEEDSKYFIHQTLSTPCLNALRSCGGIYLEDIQGRKYMDFHGNSVHQVGFSNVKVVEAIKKQLDNLSFCTRRYTNTTAINLAKKLVSIAPGLDRVLFTPGGSLAVGMALKLARYTTGRHKTISMWESFHGASLDAISVGGEEIFRGGVGPLLPGCEHVPPSDEYRCIFGCNGDCNLRCATYVEYVLEKEGDIAAVIAEPIRWMPYVPKKEYWQIIRDACHKHGALLIFDEIPNSLGRTGEMFTYLYYGVVPDMLVLGKGLGGGILPLAALLINEKLHSISHRALGHYTHEKNPTLCAAALATIEFVESEDLPGKAKVLGLHALNRLKAMMERHPLIGDVRGVGLLLGIELVTDPLKKTRANYQAELVMYKALEKGLSLKVTMGNILSLCPPLIISREELDWALDTIEQCIDDVERVTQLK